jgi:hypothetical protein
MLRIITRGQADYYCRREDGGCGWVFEVQGAAKKPISWLPAEAFFKLASFAKHYGMPALIQGLVRPFPRRDMPRLAAGDNGKSNQQRASALPENVTDEMMEHLAGALELLGDVDLASLRQLSPSPDWEAPEGGGHGEVNQMLREGKPKPDFGYVVPPEISEWTGALPELEASDEEGRPRGDRQLEGGAPG